MTRLGGLGVFALGLALTACTGASLPVAGDNQFGGDATPTPGIPTVDPSTGETIVPTVVPSVNPSTGVTTFPTIFPTPTDTGTTTPTATPTDPDAPFRSTLFSADENRRGITDTEIRICAHAALSYGAAFNTTDADLNVYWTELNQNGGIFGRQVRMVYKNDDYKPETARAAAIQCKDELDPFMLIGGIGFDQIPAVRDWAEQNHMLYIHHTATERALDGSIGNYRYSYTLLPTTEKVGEMFGELALTRFAGKKVGIIKRQSENWEGGVNGFKRVASKHGIEIVLDRPVPQNKGNYQQDINDLKNGGAEVVFVWLNALETAQFVKQAKAQELDASYMVFPFNLETQTLLDDALDPKLVGVAMWQAYSHGDYSGEFAKYADDMREFERQYAEHRPTADIQGLGGDLLFLNWSGQKALHQLLVACGKDCTRNRFVEAMHGFKAKVSSSACKIDLTRPGTGNDRRGGHTVSILQAYRVSSTKVNYRNIETCVENLI